MSESHLDKGHIWLLELLTRFLDSDIQTDLSCVADSVNINKKNCDQSVI